MTSHETDTDYAFWTSPDESFTVTYSLEQFHEIDFEVNEGYRRIPHGGIEIGGLLFGRGEPGRVRIDAFRQIQCEHATGPSFVLSDRDLEELQQQIDRAASDPDLAGLSVVGWFVAHTRSPLRLNDREISIFGRFFPGANQIVLLVKPERFQPTKFAFFPRKTDGSIERDGTNTAVILPLAGRSGRSGNGPIASIPAPSPAAPEPLVAPSASVPTSKPISKQPSAPQVDVDETQDATISQPRPEPVRTAPMERSPAPAEVSRAEQPSRREVVEDTSDTSDTGPVTSLTTLPKENKLLPIHEIQRRRGAGAQAVKDEGKAYQVRLVLVLMVAAVLGCAVGYAAYRELPAPVVPLSVRVDASGVVITWPIEQTRRAEYAAIRINDGARQPLSTDEKTAGSARIPLSSVSKVKVELIVQHWMRDSRGILRYVSPASILATAPEQQISR